MSKIQELLEKRRTFETELLVKALEDETFRSTLMRDPRAAVEMLTGQAPPEGVHFKVVEEAPNSLTLVIPRVLPQVTEESELTDEALERVSAAGTVGVVVAAVTTTGAEITAIM